MSRFRLYELIIGSSIDREKILTKLRFMKLAGSGLRAILLLFFIGSIARSQNAPSLQNTSKLQADSLHVLGSSFIKSGKYDSAQVVLQAEVKLRETLLDSLGLANGLNSLCRVMYLRGKLKEGLTVGERALSICKLTVGESDTLAARSLNNIGIIYDELGNYEKALENYNKVLSISLKVLGPEHRNVAASYGNIGLVFYELGDYEKGLEYYNKSLAIQRKLLGSEHPEVAVSYGNIGLVYYDLGDYQKALENYNRALSIRLKVLGAEHPSVAGSYNNIGVVYCILGDYEKALENHNKALSIRLKALGPDHPDVAGSYSNLGIVYNNLGDYKKALENYNRALSIRLKALGPDHLEVGGNCNNIGDAYYDLDDYPKALEYYNKALAIKLKTLGPDHLDVAGSYSNLGIVYHALSDYEKALENDNKALAIRLKALGPEHQYVAASYNNIGQVYFALGDYKKALEDYYRALSIQLKALGPDHPDVAESYYNISKVFRARKDLSQALDYLKKSIEITEKVRGGVSSEELKKTYTESVRGYYDAIITILLELGRPKEAFEYYERSKSKLLQDELNKEGVEIGQGEVRKKLGQVQSLSNQVGALEKQVIDEKSKPKSEQNSTKIENLTRLLAQTKGEFYKLVTEIKQNPDYAFTVTVDPMQFASIQKDLPAGNKLIMYYSSKDKLYILVVSNDGFRATSVDISRDSLDLLVRQFRTLIDTFQVSPDTSRTALLKTVITTLYRYLISPIQDAVTSATNLTFIPSGNLYYIPLGALAYEKDGKLRYLVEDKPVSYLTSAELIRYVERKEKANPSGSPDLLLVGDPAGADLPGAADEAKAIHTLYPKSKLYLDADATKSTVEREAPLSQILHLATHAFPDQQSPWDSYVYLVKAGEDNGRWTMSEITNQTWDKMTLVTLSACETAIGGDKPGLEMESMARAFSIAGAPSIVATLWPVYDPSTKDLMVGFYTNLKTMSKVEALRQAQLSLIQNPRYSHPYFWAPFILIGDWK